MSTQLALNPGGHFIIMKKYGSLGGGSLDNVDRDVVWHRVRGIGFILFFCRAAFYSNSSQSNFVPS